jgi:hypothetical protein
MLKSLGVNPPEDDHKPPALSDYLANKGAAA